MTSVLLDTHAWAWSLSNDHRLSEKARDAMTKADAVYVSPVSLFEIGQKVRIGKWPEMAPFAPQLVALIEEQGALVAALLPDAALHAALMNWTHRDPFDRLLASTAIRIGISLVSADVVFDELAGTEGWKGRLW
jgi:PIN domain nuclease of toxin-antitoxin system